MIDFNKKIWVLDGAMGTMIQKYSLTESDFRGEKFAGHNCRLQGCNDLLSITQPEIIGSIHREYLEAGADIIETNSFNANIISLEEYGLQQYDSEINRQAASIARKEADLYMSLHPEREIYVAGSMGPTSKSLTMSAELGDSLFCWDILYDAYCRQAAALIEGGVDLLLVETAFDSLNAKCALKAAIDTEKKHGRSLPIMLSATLTESGRTLSGQTPEALLTTMASFPIASIGLNCGFGADTMAAHLRRLADAPCALSAYPNAGLPNAMGQYDQLPEHTAQAMEEMMKLGMVNIVGGCCGTTPQHIAAIANVAAKYSPRKIPTRDNTKEQSMWLAGLETLEISAKRNFINIGERCNVAGSRKFLRLIKEGNIEEAIDVARSQIEAGATIIDINMDDAMLDAPKQMSLFLQRIATEPDIAKVPFMIDSSNWDVIISALKMVQGKPIVNSISLKEGEKKFLEKAAVIKSYGASVVVMCFDEDGQAVSYERKIAIAERSYRLLTEKAGFSQNDIVIDPNILTIATGIEEHNNYALDFLHTTKWIKQHLPGARVSGGVSNLSFAFRGNNYLREAMHALFLYHNIQQGMDMAIVNAANLIPIDDIPSNLRKAIEDVLFNSDEEAVTRLVELAQSTQDSNPVTIYNTEPDVTEKNPQELLSNLIVKGRSEGMERLIDKLLSEGMSAYEIINVPLMNGMNLVGDLFSKGKMFLPQVVKSARAMKHTVAYLTPIIEKEKSKHKSGTKIPKVIMATVKGDVHDIGKNIVDVILNCNGCQIIDLGVMVPPEKIIEIARKENADFIGLSGLITPSLEEMSHVAKMLQQQKMSIPLLIGGATTSEQHTAIKIAPLYDAPVVHTRDAAQLPDVIKKISDSKTTAQYIKSLKERQQILRNNHSMTFESLLPLEEARKYRHSQNWNDYTSHPFHEGIADRYIPISQLRSHINWRPFFTAWKMDAAMAHIAELGECDHCKAEWLAAIPSDKKKEAVEALQLFKDANRAIDFIEQNVKSGILIRTIALKAMGCNEDIILSDGTVIPTLRRQSTPDNNNSKLCPALSDFVAPSESYNDKVGMFVATVGMEIENIIDLHAAKEDSYNEMLYQSIAHRLVEAAIETFHSNLPGIRPAVGYSSLPDQSLIHLLNKYLHYDEIGVRITSNGAMAPSATISGLLITNPDAHYFTLGRIGDDQREIYAQKRGYSIEESFKWVKQPY